MCKVKFISSPQLKDETETKGYLSKLLDPIEINPSVKYSEQE